MSWLVTIGSAAISAIVGAAIGQAFGKIKEIKRKSTMAENALNNGVQALLKNELYEAYHQWPDGNAPDSVKDRIQDIYTPYHDMGGNSNGTRMYRAIMGINQGDK